MYNIYAYTYTYTHIEIYSYIYYTSSAILHEKIEKKQDFYTAYNDNYTTADVGIYYYLKKGL